MSAVSKRTIRLTPEYVDGPYIDDLRCDGLTNPHRLMKANAQDIRTTHDIAWSDHPAIPAAIHAPALVTHAAVRARLATVALIYLDSATCLVVELCGDLSSAGLADLLRPHTVHLLSGFVEWRADVARRTGKRGNDLMRGLVDQVVHAAARFGEHLFLAPLHASPAS